MILIVDDHSDSSTPLQRLLAKVGYRSEVVSSGEEAMGFVHAVKPKLIVLDVMMPGMSGIDVLRQLRSEPELKDIPVLLYTAHANEEAEAEAWRLGVNDCLSKAKFGWTQLLERIESAYDKPPVPRESRREPVSYQLLPSSRQMVAMDRNWAMLQTARSFSPADQNRKSNPT